MIRNELHRSPISSPLLMSSCSLKVSASKHCNHGSRSSKHYNTRADRHVQFIKTRVKRKAVLSTFQPISTSGNAMTRVPTTPTFLPPLKNEAIFCVPRAMIKSSGETRCFYRGTQKIGL
ncbi:hypothetical protein ElyMa_003371300 [Elysia marginata]|uniref:Uncharacterized protein n=1 Tax=Elysia marginata TaxID=1093978 RepID=A0AAV4JLF6_9GAST|nr:hypothetical protein ElyMa_003371300 [Elysia marginata]